MKRILDKKIYENFEKFSPSPKSWDLAKFTSVGIFLFDVKSFFLKSPEKESKQKKIEIFKNLVKSKILGL